LAGGLRARRGSGCKESCEEEDRATPRVHGPAILPRGISGTLTEFDSVDVVTGNDELGSIIAPGAVGAMIDVLGEKIGAQALNSDHGPPALHSALCAAASAFCFAKAPILVFIRHAQILALASVGITDGDDRNH
jgi:hypothetical protein